MKNKTKQLLQDAMDWCDKHDMSVPYTIRYMCIVAKVDHSTAVDFIRKSNPGSAVMLVNGRTGEVIKELK